jgi:hypothetical protein
MNQNTKAANILLKVASKLVLTQDESMLMDIAKSINKVSKLKANPPMGKVSIKRMKGVGAELIIPFMFTNPNRSALVSARNDTAADAKDLMSVIRKCMKGLHPEYSAHSDGDALGFAIKLIVPLSQVPQLKKSVNTIGKAIPGMVKALRGAYKSRLKEELKQKGR